MNETIFAGASFLFGLMRWFVKTPELGAQTTIYCAVDENVAHENGLYYSDCEKKEPSKNAKKMEDAEKLWNISWKMVGLDENYDPFKQ